MASYTQLNLDESEKILNLYGIKGVEKLTPMGHGISNTNYRVDLNGAKPVLLKISNDKNYQELSEEMIILHRLNHAGFQLSLTPFKTLTHSLVYHAPPFHGVLFPFVEGKVEMISTKILNEMGIAMAQLHQTPVALNNLRNYDNVGFSPQKINSYCSSTDAVPDFAKAFKELKGEKMVENWEKSHLPQGLIHGDMYYDNILFHEGRILAILDFEQAGIGDYLFDIGIALSGSALHQGKIDNELVKEFLQGYQSVKKLTTKELELIPSSIILGLFSISLWRIKRFTIGNIDPSKKESYKELIIRAQHYFKDSYHEHRFK
jgi:homoserine kinase type II